MHTPDPTQQQTTDATPELSRPVRIDDLGLQAFTLDIVPSADELAALGALMKVVKLDALSAHTTLQLLPSGDVVLKATFTARVTQTCVVTLQPVTDEISAEFTTTYSHSADDEDGQDEEEYADYDDAIDPAERIVEGTIDLGEAISEHLALEIDPFPRVKDATFDGYSSGPKDLAEAPQMKKNPFAVLAKLKETPKST